MTNYHYINTDLIQNTMMNNTDMIKSFVSLYLSQGKSDFEDLTKAVKENNYQEIAQRAHHIKPTMEYIGASDTRILFQKIETLCKEEGPLTDIHHNFIILEKQFNTIMDELQDFYSSLV